MLKYFFKYLYLLYKLHYLFHFTIFLQWCFYIGLDIIFFLLSLYWGISQGNFSMTNPATSGLLSCGVRCFCCSIQHLILQQSDFILSFPCSVLLFIFILISQIIFFLPFFPDSGEVVPNQRFLQVGVLYWLWLQYLSPFYLCSHSFFSTVQLLSLLFSFTTIASWELHFSSIIVFNFSIFIAIFLVSCYVVFRAVKAIYLSEFLFLPLLHGTCTLLLYDNTF